MDTYITDSDNTIVTFCVDKDAWDAGEHSNHLDHNMSSVILSARALFTFSGNEPNSKHIREVCEDEGMRREWVSE